jgi:hypothetical protein
MLTGGEMSRSEEDRSQEINPGHSNQPSLHDYVEQTDRPDIIRERTGEEDVSLVEQILEFLDKYPSCLARQTTLTGSMQGC